MLVLLASLVVLVLAMFGASTPITGKFSGQTIKTKTGTYARCARCGKPVFSANSTAQAGGHLCAINAQRTSNKAAFVLNAQPNLKNVVSVAQVHKLLAANKTPISKLVAGFGGDGWYNYAAHVTMQVHCYGTSPTRYIAAFYGTKQGLQIIATGNYSKVPVAVNAQMPPQVISAYNAWVTSAQPAQ